ncbi:cytochrome P450 monooxygenase-like protein [Paraphoma chrysanthemicola]|uniref:Cytochrome P450 monooxygenase-like protein n=1 Tax=Paraphoma chrysanthemicola TaxID=798071 RepID=A0A8K0QZV1_9PLEO|nr:cytochrome P450 monooxygenase-like protein [Paraphoma chrysanthemicola]
MAFLIGSSSTSTFQLFTPVGIALSAGLLVVLLIGHFLYTNIRNIFFHPLKKIPGPKLAAGSGIPYSLHMRNGTMVDWLKQLHDTYGEAVRVAPNEVSFISGETAWADIYGFRTGKHKNTGPYLKDQAWFPQPINGSTSMISADEANHSRMRRNMSHAFSDKALREQEPLVQQYVDLLVHRLGELAAENKQVDIMQWYNYTTFDVICDLTFGEPLYCLRDSKEHIWVKLVYANLATFGILSTRVKYPIFAYWDRLKLAFTNTKNIMATRMAFFNRVHDKVAARLEKGTDRHDFFSYITKNQEVEGKALTQKEMDTNAILFLSAGSETTATLLSGVTYLVLANPATYAKLTHEIRAAFTSVNQITADSVSKLEYMLACLQEGLRMYPPVPTGFARIVPGQGDNISGHYIPGGTSVYISQHAMNHSSRYFHEPEKFAPERWLGDAEYAQDKRDIVQAFSYGPRNCLGKNLAFVEMRLILAKILFTFDLELVDKKTDWMRGQKLFTLWNKPPLMVNLKPVKR